MVTCAQRGAIVARLSLLLGLASALMVGAALVFEQTAVQTAPDWAYDLFYSWPLLLAPAVALVAAAGGTTALRDREETRGVHIPDRRATEANLGTLLAVVGGGIALLIQFINGIWFTVFGVGLLAGYGTIGVASAALFAWWVRRH